ncbi:hypothetical protein FKM82_002396 [Ascaphus truei]
MLTVTFHPRDLGQDETRSHIHTLQNYFTRGPGSVCNLTSLYHQESPVTSPPRLLHGCPHLVEQVMGLKLRLSPDAFLQVNTPGAELLYTALRELSGGHAHCALLDVCCGTGGIGLSLAGQFREVVGVEMVDQAVYDARWNADVNGVQNCRFHAGKAEKLLPQLLMDTQEAEPMVAVVNPPRAGLHPRVVRAIRSCENIRTLLYVSCKPEGEASDNLTQLCSPPSPEQRILGEAFVPQAAVAIDLFPHTAHCELILCLER